MDALKAKQLTKAMFWLTVVIGYSLLFCLLGLYALLRFGNESFRSHLLMESSLSNVLANSWFILAVAFVVAAFAFILRSKKTPFQFGSSRMLLYLVYFSMILSAVAFVYSLLILSGENIAVKNGNVLVQRDGSWEQVSGNDAVQIGCNYYLGKLAKVIVAVCALVSIWVSKWVGWDEKHWRKSRPVSRQKAAQFFFL